MSGDCPVFDPVAFGARTLAAMGERTCRDVAPEIGLSRSTLNRVTRGFMPTVPVYLSICHWLSRTSTHPASNARQDEGTVV